MFYLDVQKVIFEKFYIWKMYAMSYIIKKKLIYF